MKWLRVVLVPLICCLCAISTEAADRLPIPDDAAQKAALVTVKDVFRQDLAAAKSASQQVELGQRMLRSLEEKPEAATANYVLLIQAQGLAVKAFNPELTRQVIDELAKRYEVDPLLLRVAAIRDLSKGPTDAKLHGDLAQTALVLVDDCVEQERFEVAVSALELANSLSIRSKSNDLRKQSATRKAEVTELQKLWTDGRKARDTLSKSPQDAAANDALGRYLIVAKNDWDQGLKHWVLSSDKEIQKAAKQDNDVLDALGPSSMEKNVALGDSWWDLAAKQSSPVMKAAMKLRAGQWYESILVGLEGLSKARADQRITESRWLNDPAVAKHMPRSRTWEKLNPRFAAVEGWFNGKFALCQAAPFEEALSLNQVLTLWKFRPIRFRPYRTSNGLKVAAIWHKSPVESELTRGSQYEVRQREEQLRAKGLLPCDLAGYVNERGEDEFVVVWANSKPKGANEVVMVLSHPWGERLDTAMEGFGSVTNQNFWSSKPEQLLNTIRKKPAPSFWHHYWSNRESVKQKLDESKAESKAVCVDVCISAPANESDAGKLNWSITLESLPDTEFVEVHQPNFAKGLAEWRKLMDSGHVPVAIGAVSLRNGPTVSSTIWHRPIK